MRLTELSPHFLILLPDNRMKRTDNLEEAQGIMFLCPVCFEKNGGPIGTHSVLCWFKNRGVPDDVSPKPGRWNPAGTGYTDLTFVGPGATSIWLRGGGDSCGWHGFITKGEVTRINS